MNEAVSFEDFLDFLEIDQEMRLSASSMLADTSLFYRQFSIPKRKGGQRLINSPYPSLHSVQRSILEKILLPLQVHERALAYKRGSNAIQHAAVHVGSDELLTLDITDFFGSISRQMVYQVLSNCGVPSRFSNFVAILCCREGSLPQGACTSPQLSNLVFRALDERLCRLGRKLGLLYSRYADDIAFSGQRVPPALIDLVSRILGSKNFTLNSTKTRLKVIRAKKIITGVSISSGTLKAPRTFKRKLRAQVHQLESHADNLASLPFLDPLIYERVLGRLNYLLQIEPDNIYARTKKERLSKLHQEFLSQVGWETIQIELARNEPDRSELGIDLLG